MSCFKLTCMALSFVASSFVFCLETSQSQSFEKISEQFIYETAPFPSCHASTIVQCADGTIASAWFGGTDEKADDVGIWFSRFDKGTWSTPIEVANGIQFQWSSLDHSATDVKRFPTWNPVLFQPKTGPLLLFYKCGPSPQSWWGMIMESHDSGLTWTKPSRLPDGILGPIKNKPVELPDGTILCPTSNETDDTDEWTVHMEWTNDLGKTWTRTKPLNDPKKFGAIQPSILFLGNERLLALGRSRQGKIFQIESNNLGKTWSEMSLIDLPNPNSGTDAITLKDGRHLLIYNHVTKQSAEWGGRRSPLNLAVSSDAKSWTPVMELENEPKMEFSYPAIIQASDGRVHITYTWKRLKIKHVILDLKTIAP
ncbi:MAG: exo-alpha-sialidase [Pirellula sp.]|nr:exo-alpha-sialidase [Pirellula sp.]